MAVDSAQEAYDAAIDFIRLSDHMRLFTDMGGTPTPAMCFAFGEARARFDSARRRSLWASNAQRWESNWMVRAA